MWKLGSRIVQSITRKILLWFSGDFLSPIWRDTWKSSTSSRWFFEGGSFPKHLGIFVPSKTLWQLHIIKYLFKEKWNSALLILRCSTGGTEQLTSSGKSGWTSSKCWGNNNNNNNKTFPKAHLKPICSPGQDPAPLASMFTTALHSCQEQNPVGFFLPCSPSTSNSKENRIVSTVGLFCRDLSNPTWRYSGVLQILPNPQRMGFVPVSPWQNLQRDQICFPPPWLCSKCFKGAAQAGFTHNFVGFWAPISNLTHRPTEVTTITISLFSPTPKQKTPQVI